MLAGGSRKQEAGIQTLGVARYRNTRISSAIGYWLSVIAAQSAGVYALNWRESFRVSQIAASMSDKTFTGG
jgi:hypothetical protein